MHSTSALCHTHTYTHTRARAHTHTHKNNNNQQQKTNNNNKLKKKRGGGRGWGAGSDREMHAAQWCTRSSPGSRMVLGNKQPAMAKRHAVCQHESVLRCTTLYTIARPASSAARVVHTGALGYRLLLYCFACTKGKNARVYALLIAAEYRTRNLSMLYF